MLNNQAVPISLNPLLHPNKSLSVNPLIIVLSNTLMLSKPYTIFVIMRGKNIKVKQVIQAVKVSRSNLEMRFKQELNKKPKQYRINHAYS